MFYTLRIDVWSHVVYFFLIIQKYFRQLRGARGPLNSSLGLCSTSLRRFHTMQKTSEMNNSSLSFRFFYLLCQLSCVRSLSFSPILSVLVSCEFTAVFHLLDLSAETNQIVYVIIPTHSIGHNLILLSVNSTYRKLFTSVFRRKVGQRVGLQMLLNRLNYCRFPWYQECPPRRHEFTTKKCILLSYSACTMWYCTVNVMWCVMIFAMSCCLSLWM